MGFEFRTCVASSERSRQVRGLPVLDDIDLQDLHAHNTRVGRNISCARKEDIMPHEKGNPNSHGARPVCQNHLDDKVESDQ